MRCGWPRLRSICRGSARKYSATGRGRSFEEIIGIEPPSLGGIPGVGDEGGSASNRSVDSSQERWVYGLGVGAAWEADVWGRIRSKKAAAQAESDALAYDYEFARQSLAAAVARAYFSTIEASQQAANAAEVLSYYGEALKLADVRKEQGHASDFDLAQIKARAPPLRRTRFTSRKRPGRSRSVP